jgi:hypothetical protein
MPLCESLRIAPSAFATAPTVCDFSECPFPAPHLCVLARSTAGGDQQCFNDFFYDVHSHFSPPVTSYSDDLRVCIDACMRGYGGEWPSGMVPLSSQTQAQVQLQSDLLADPDKRFWTPEITYAVDRGR